MGDTKQSDYKLLVDTAVMAGQLMLASGQRFTGWKIPWSGFWQFLD